MDLVVHLVAKSHLDIFKCQAKETRNPSAMKNSTIIETLEEALALHKSFRHDEAEKLYARVRFQAPKNFDGWFLSGAMAFQRGGHLEKAVELLTKARKLQPQSLECRMFLGMALADLDRHKRLSPILKKPFPK